MILYLQKFEPSKGDILNQVWLKLAMWFWRRFSYACLLFRYYFPPGKGCGLHLNNFIIISLWKRYWPFILTNLNSLYPIMLCAEFGWNWPRISWEEDRRQAIRKAHLNFQLRWAKISNKMCLWNTMPPILANSSQDPHHIGTNIFVPVERSCHKKWPCVIWKL